MKARVYARPGGSQRRCEGGAPGPGPRSPGAAAGQHGLHLARGIVGGGTGGEVQEGRGSGLGPSSAGPWYHMTPPTATPPTEGPPPGHAPRRCAARCPSPGVWPLAAWVTPVPERYSPRVTRAEESSLNSEKDVSFSSSFSFAQGLAVTSNAQ